MPYVNRDKDKKITAVFVPKQHKGQEYIKNLNDPDLAVFYQASSDTEQREKQIRDKLREIAITALEAEIKA